MIPRRTKTDRNEPRVYIHSDRLDYLIEELGGKQFAWRDQRGRTHVSHMLTPNIPWEDWSHDFKNQIRLWIKKNADRPIEIKIPEIKLPTPPRKAVSMASSKKSIFENTAPAVMPFPFEGQPEVGAKRKKFAGEHINDAHVRVPFKGALIDGGSITAVYLVVYPWTVWFDWAEWMGLGYFSFSVLTVFTISTVIDWWWDKRKILRQKIEDEWEHEPEPEGEKVYPPMTINVTKTDPRTGEDTVTHFNHIAFLIPDGWSYAKFRDACTNVINKGSFSQGSAGLNPKPYKAFRKQFLEYQHEYGCTLIYWKDDTNHNLGMTMTDDCKEILRAIADDIEIAKWMKFENL